MSDQEDMRHIPEDACGIIIRAKEDDPGTFDITLVFPRGVSGKNLLEDNAPGTVHVAASMISLFSEASGD